MTREETARRIVEAWIGNDVELEEIVLEHLAERDEAWQEYAAAVKSLALETARELPRSKYGRDVRHRELERLRFRRDEAARAVGLLA